MKKIFAICILLAGCVTFGQLESGLNKLVGRDEDTAFRALGYPDGKQEFGSRTVYVWSNNRRGVMFMPNTTTTTGYVGNVPVYGSTTTQQAVPINHECTIKLTVAGGRVNSWDYQGNLGGCQSYIQRLNNFIGR